ncbi:formate dehydrogenase, nitrate-inducible, cytochrome b556(fdn) subunit [Kosakonia radicincitans]|nr:formate dehydrogenase, nitrate-inducible, cytochrome b556(fdn) subunit [Kosakonia sp. MH5]PTA92645.1 formate dehydrogenase, nitrate-inducible, cytochrome b556(fdn) subunit [Kosakonia sp. H7A]QEM94122.1 formate dehydrogenase, nitrate-inducible, cytochrome b556(fdn) subunit [Kosakonia radicincitans]
MRRQRNKVSRRWAKKHHPRWYREVEAAERKPQP